MRKHEWTDWDVIVDRLLNSRNPLERNSLFGQTSPHGFPVLLDVDLLFEHLHILGPTGSGKTSLGLESIIIQLVRRDDGPVIVIDCKGDTGLFHTVREEAAYASRIFKWFTNKVRSTYAFNPWDPKLLAQLTISEVIGLLTQSLNLHHGDDYGRAWFSIAARMLLKRAVEDFTFEQRPVSDLPENDVTEWLEDIGGDDYGYSENDCGDVEAHVVWGDHIILWQDRPITDLDKKNVVYLYEGTAERRRVTKEAISFLETHGLSIRRGWYLNGNPASDVREYLDGLIEGFFPTDEAKLTEEVIKMIGCNPPCY